jgi:NAD(P)-dependent dehydrogenase (short-subunit alcohol dehydrogenase family)
MNITLTGKIGIVTGAASGIGLAIVQSYVEAGARVVAVDLTPEPKELQPLSAADKVRYLRGDVAVEQTAREFTQLACDAFGRIDILVNNAAVSVVKPLYEHTLDEWDAVMNSNLKAAFLAVRAVVPLMMRQRSGVILNTGSISGEVGIPAQGAYAPSKGALHQLTRQLAIEHAPHGIRVNAIGLGTVDTPLVHRSAAASGDPDKFWAMLRDNHPIGRIASPVEVAAFFTYLASDLASFLTGAILMMDGGFTAK